MASNVVNYLNDIAKAVQAKKKSSDKIALKNLASEIRSFKTSVDELSDTMATNRVITTNGTYNVLNDKTITINVADIDDLAPFFQNDNYGSGDIVATLIYNDPEYGYSTYTAERMFDGLILNYGYGHFVELSDYVNGEPLYLYKDNSGYIDSASSVYIDGEVMLSPAYYGDSEEVFTTQDPDYPYGGYYIPLEDSYSYTQKEGLYGYGDRYYKYNGSNSKIESRIGDLRLYLNTIPSTSVITQDYVFNNVYSSDIIYKDNSGNFNMHTLSNEEIIYSQNGSIQSLDLYYSGSRSGDPTQHYAVVCNSSYSGSVINYHYMGVGDVLYKPYATSGTIDHYTLDKHNMLFRHTEYNSENGNILYDGMQNESLGYDDNECNSKIAYFDVNDQCILTTDLQGAYGNYVAFPDDNGNLDFEDLSSDKIVYCTASNGDYAEFPSVATMDELTPLIFYNYKAGGSNYTSILDVENDIIASTTYDINTHQATTNLVFSSGGDYTSSAYTLAQYNTTLDLDLYDALIYNHRIKNQYSSGYNYEYRKIDVTPGTILTVDDDYNIQKAPYDLSSGAVVNEVEENDVFIADGNRELQEVTLTRNTIIANDSSSIPTVTELPVGQVAYYTGSNYNNMIEFTNTAAIREPIILYRYKENGMAELNWNDDIYATVTMQRETVYGTGETIFNPYVNLVFKYQYGYSSGAFAIYNDNIAIDLPDDAVMFSTLDDNNQKVIKGVSFDPYESNRNLLFTPSSGSYPTFMSIPYDARGKFFMYLDTNGNFQHKYGGYGIIQKKDGSSITVTESMINALVDAGILDESERF